MQQVSDTLQCQDNTHCSRKDQRWDLRCLWLQASSRRGTWRRKRRILETASLGTENLDARIYSRVASIGCRPSPSSRAHTRSDSSAHSHFLLLLLLAHHTLTELSEQILPLFYDFNMGEIWNDPYLSEKLE